MKVWVFKEWLWRLSDSNKKVYNQKILGLEIWGRNQTSEFPIRTISEDRFKFVLTNKGRVNASIKTPRNVLTKVSRTFEKYRSLAYMVTKKSFEEFDVVICDEDDELRKVSSMEIEGNRLVFNYE